MALSIDSITPDTVADGVQTTITLMVSGDIQNGDEVQVRVNGQVISVSGVIANQVVFTNAFSGPGTYAIDYVKSATGEGSGFAFLTVEAPTGGGSEDDDFGWPDLPLGATYAKVELEYIDAGSPDPLLSEWLVLTERWDVQLTTLDGIDTTPAIRPQDIEIDGIDGVVQLSASDLQRLTYEKGEVTLSLVINGNLNPDGSVQTTLSPSVRARQLKQNLLRRTTGQFRLRVTAADGSIWQTTCFRTGPVEPKGEVDSRDVQSLTITAQRSDPFWTQQDGFWQSSVLSGVVTLDDLDGCGRITDAQLLITSDGSLTVTDLTNGSTFTYADSANSLLLVTNQTTDPLVGGGNFKALTWQNSLSVLTIGDGRQKPQLQINGGSIQVTCFKKSLNPF